jgi:septal ring factor EnvC (AmiA/AmiB activator)
MGRGQSVACYFLVGLTLMMCTLPGQADEEDAGQALEAVRSRIAELSADLGRSQLQRDALATELRRTEEQIAETTRAVNGLGREIAAKNERLAALHQREDVQEQRLAQHRAVLAKQLRQGYLLGRQDYLKVLLNQGDPAALSRGLAYHRYVTRARTDQVRSITQELAVLEALRADAASEAMALQDLREQQLAARETLETNREHRQHALGEMHKRIDETGNRLDDLRNNERDLVELVRALERELALLPNGGDPRSPFAGVEGELRWPAGGEIRNAFGAPVEGSDLSWQGVLIEAPAGQAVHAVWGGRVVFADWLKGFGLLLIIDHGEAYMSLYGHNEALYKDVGEAVRAGEVVATVGSSGGRLEPGLYFEIRHQGVPQNPERWCAHPPPSTQDVLVSG